MLDFLSFVVLIALCFIAGGVLWTLALWLLVKFLRKIGVKL